MIFFAVGAALCAERITGSYQVSDNGSEFACSRAVRGWLRDLGVKTLFIEPGSPWENGYIESFNGKFRDELLNGEIFDTLTKSKVLIEMWKQEYNRFRPHSSLGYKPPTPEAKTDLDPRIRESAIYTSEFVPKLSQIVEGNMGASQCSNRINHYQEGAENE